MTSETEPTGEFNHFNRQGQTHLVDVSAKEATFREAMAESWVSTNPETWQKIVDRQFSKGDVLEVARLAGIMATKRTADLIPLCHPLAIERVTVQLEPVAPNRVHIVATVSLHGKTGVEMEALTAATVAGLTIYDMCKAVDRAIVLGPTRLLSKRGGKSGHFQAASTTTN